LIHCSLYGLLKSVNFERGKISSFSAGAIVVILDVDLTVEFTDCDVRPKYSRNENWYAVKGGQCTFLEVELVSLSGRYKDIVTGELNNEFFYRMSHDDSKVSGDGLLGVTVSFLLYPGYQVSVTKGVIHVWSDEYEGEYYFKIRIPSGGRHIVTGYKTRVDDDDESVYVSYGYENDCFDSWDGDGSGTHYEKCLNKLDRSAEHFALAPFYYNPN